MTTPRRPHPARRRTKRRLAAALAAALALGSESRAQSFGATSTGAAVIPATLNLRTPDRCANGVWTQGGAGINTAAIQCSHSTGTFTAAASVSDDGLIRARATAAQGNGSQVDVSGGMRAEASWFDIVTFDAGSVTPAFVRLDAHFTGMLAASAPDLPQHEADARAAYALVGSDLAAGQGTQANGSAQVDAGWTTNPQRRRPTDVEVRIDEVLSVVLPVAPGGPNGRTGFIFGYYFAAQTSTSTSNNYPSATLRGTSDFSNTGALSALSFLDANQQVITEGVRYTFAKGTRIVPVATSVVPEPGTWALLGAGLLAVGGEAGRRRRRPA